LTGATDLSPELQQILSVAGWFLTITFLQLALYPALKKTFGRYAYPVAFAGSLLLFTLISWYCGLARIPVQLALVPFAALFAWHAITREYTIADLKEQWRWELVFAIFFFLMLEVRYVNPTISYAEKFMDHAFLASVMRQPVVPPLDPWFAGGTLNVYYYLGYWMFGCLALACGVPSNIAFNLALPTVLGVSAVTLYAIGDLLLERFRWLPLLALLIPNPSFFWQVVQGKGPNAIIWDSTRTIANTINEYPLFSFIWGDMHAHVIGIFNQIFLLFLLAFAYKKWGNLTGTGRWVLIILSSISLGSMPLINTWDVLIYAPITVLVGILIWWQNRSVWTRSDALPFLLATPPLSIACYLPFYLQLRTSTGGFAFVDTPSVPVEFLLVHGFFIAILLVLLARDIIQRPYLVLFALPFVLAGYPAAAIAVVPLVYLIAKKPHELPHILAILGLVLITITEIVYMKDNMGETYFRMNTVFKCYIAAWLLLAISSLTMAGQALARWNRIPTIPRAKQAAAIIAAVAFLAAIPLLVPLDLNYGSRSLDGLAYLQASHPGDAAAVAYLRALPVSAGDRIVEAEGGDYTYYSRISSFTGIPAVIGMPFHEYMWRGDGDSWYSGRINDIRAIYEQPDRTSALLQKYNVTYLIVGEPEREKYNVTLPASGLELVFFGHGTAIYRPTA
jgi:YYY domain-containing protein